MMELRHVEGLLGCVAEFFLFLYLGCGYKAVHFIIIS